MLCWCMWQVEFALFGLLPGSIGLRGRLQPVGEARDNVKVRPRLVPATARVGVSSSCRAMRSAAHTLQEWSALTAIRASEPTNCRCRTSVFQTCSGQYDFFGVVRQVWCSRSSSSPHGSLSRLASHLRSGPSHRWSCRRHTWTRGCGWDGAAGARSSSSPAGARPMRQVRFLPSLRPNLHSLFAGNGLQCIEEPSKRRAQGNTAYSSSPTLDAAVRQAASAVSITAAWQDSDSCL